MKCREWIGEHTCAIKTAKSHEEIELNTLYICFLFIYLIIIFTNPKAVFRVFKLFQLRVNRFILYLLFTLAKMFINNFHLCMCLCSRVNVTV